MQKLFPKSPDFVAEDEWSNLTVHTLSYSFTFAFVLPFHCFLHEQGVN